MPTPEAHEAMIQRVIEVGRKVGTPTGVHCMDPETALRRADEGMQFLAVASELRMLNAKVQEYVQVLWPDQAGKDLARY